MLSIEQLDGKAKEFAEACFDMNSIAELQDALRNGADQTDCTEWNITENEWEKSIEAVLNEFSLCL